MADFDNDYDSGTPRRSPYAPSTPFDFLRNPSSLWAPDTGSEETSVVPPGSYPPQPPDVANAATAQVPAAPGGAPLSPAAPHSPENPLDMALGRSDAANKAYLDEMKAGPQQFHPSVLRRIVGIGLGTMAGMGGQRTGYGRYSGFSSNPQEAFSVANRFTFGPQSKMNQDYQRQLLAAKVGADEAGTDYQRTRQQNEDWQREQELKANQEFRNRPQIIDGYSVPADRSGATPIPITGDPTLMPDGSPGPTNLPEALALQKQAASPEKGNVTDMDINGQNHKVLVDPNITGKANKGIVKDYGPSKLPQITPGQQDNRVDRSYQFHTKEFDTIGKPIQDRSDRLQRLQISLNQNDPAADALVAPELLTAMAGGQGSGLRMNEAEISRIVGGRNNWETIKSQLSKWQSDPSKPFQILPAQRAQYQSLVNAMSERVQGKVQLLTQMQQRLADANDPAIHKQLLAEMKQRMANIDNIEDAVAKDAGGRTVYKSSGKFIYNDGSEYQPPNASTKPAAKPKGQQ